MSNNKVEDDSQDKKYFILTPQIVWALCRDPYDFTLWNVIKMVAAEKGECYISTENLATLAMMSTGKVSESRQYLIKVGLLKGEIRKELEYPQPVWHLRVPDLWPKNVEWRQKFDAIKDRVAYKIEQKDSLHQVKPSPGEEGPPPGETKKNHNRTNKKEGATPETENDYSSTGNPEPPTQPEPDSLPQEVLNIEPEVIPPAAPPTDALEEAFGPNLRTLAAQPVQKSITHRLKENDPTLLAEALGLSAQAAASPGRQKLLDAGWYIQNDRHETAIAAFIDTTGINPPGTKAERSKWIKGVKDHLEEFALDKLPKLYRLAWKEYEQSVKEGKLDITWPGALTNKMRSLKQREEQLQPTLFKATDSIGGFYV